MRSFKNILAIANADSEKDSAVEQAVELARQNGAALKIVSLVEKATTFSKSGAASSRDLEGLTQQRKAELERLAAPIQAHGIEVCTKVLGGPSEVAISREVSSETHDLVIMKVEGEQVINSRMFGTLAQRLIHVCPCPLWLVQPSETRPYRRILAAVDFAGREAHCLGLNNKIMELAISLAQSQANAIDVVHAWGVPTTALASNTDISYTNFIRLERTAGATAAKRLTEFLTPWSVGIPHDQIHLVSGPADTNISRLAAERDVDAIVMGSVGRTRIARFFTGNTAERVLRQVNCSVVVVKPDALASPLKYRRRVAALDGQPTGNSVNTNQQEGTF